jgi:large subunit ribosomal protein L21
MYAIIRTGGKQAKVREGDVIDVERLRAEGEVTFTPVLVVDGKGKVFSGREELSTATVTARVIGESAGDKIDIFKYKAKTGYRKRGGHRQKYTQIEVLQIQAPKAAKAAAAEPKADASDQSDAAPAKAAAPAKKAPAKKAPAKAAAPAKKAPAKKAPAKKAAAAKPKATTTKKKSDEAPKKAPARKKAPAKKKPVAKKDEEG